MMNQEQTSLKDQMMIIVLVQIFILILKIYVLVYVCNSWLQNQTHQQQVQILQSHTTFGTFTVPAGMTSVNIKAWGAGGGRIQTLAAPNGGGQSGTLHVVVVEVILQVH